MTPTMVPVARRTLFAERRRAILAVAGVAVALTLVLVFDAILAGGTDRLTFYLRTSPADVFISQSGVKTMHMSSSAVPVETIKTAQRVEGVYWTAPLAFMTATLGAGREQTLSYVFGYDTVSGGGGPAQMEGAAPGRGQAVIDRTAAGQLGVGIGDRVLIASRTFTVTGLSQGGTTLTNSTTYVDIRDFPAFGRWPLSYVLVGAAPGQDPEALAERLAQALPRATVQTRDQFISQEESLVADMAADVMRLMTIIAFILALAVIALVLSAVTRANLRSYAVIGAIGAPPRRLARLLAGQALWTALPAAAAATGLTSLIALIMPRLADTLPMTVRPAMVLQITAACLVAAAIGALLPLRAITAVDPATAFRRAT